MAQLLGWLAEQEGDEDGCWGWGGGANLWA